VARDTDDLSFLLQTLGHKQATSSIVNFSCSLVYLMLGCFDEQQGIGNGDNKTMATTAHIACMVLFFVVLTTNRFTDKCTTCDDNDCGSEEDKTMTTW
jgi:hypothetical protein